jgi:membrane-associated phospholipid phosphatase
MVEPMTPARTRTRACIRARALAALAAAALFAAPSTAAAEIKSNKERAIRIAAIAAAMGIYITSETVAKDALDPDTCTWCDPGPVDLNFREVAVWSEAKQPLAADLSNLIGYGMTPIGVSALLLFASASTSPSRPNRGLDDMITMFEIVWATQLVTQAVKISVARQRPYVHRRLEEDPNIALPLSQEDNLSFFSGHSSLTFSIAVGAGMLAHQRGYRLEPVIWGTGLALAASTAYLRMAADRHYFTDVLTGAAIGSLGAIFIPRLTRSFPGDTSIVPQPNGLALVGRF